MNLVNVKCAFCGKEYFRPAGRVNEAKKFGWKQYCSKECQRQSKFRRVEKVCGNINCNKMATRQLNEFKKSKSGLIFCSRSCAVIVNNSKKDYSRRRKIRICCNCGKQFFGRRKYCSTPCRPTPPGLPLGYQRTSKKQIINEIKDFFKKNGRIPVKREYHRHYRHYYVARRRFGTWNEAMKAAGFEPNPVLFAKKQIANDGHKCDSISEKIIDDWLYARKITHKRNVPYPEKPSFTCDFVTENNWVEFFGLAGDLEKYDRSMEKKFAIAKRNSLPLIEIYPKDLFPVNRLAEIIKV